MKYLCFILLSSMILFGSRYEGSTTSAVILAGGIIKSTHIDVSDKKYKRKDCPVCKGTGYYISGDGIKKVDCGYCEPDKKESVISTPNKVITHSQAPSSKCNSPNCKAHK